MQHGPRLLDGQMAAGGEVLKRNRHGQHVARRIVLHLAALVDAVIRRRQLELLRRQRLPRLSPRPSEVVAIVVQGDVGVLAGVEAGLAAVGQHLIGPAQNVQGHAAETLAAGGLRRVNVVFQQLGVVIGHLLEMRHSPMLVHAVAVKPAGQLVVDAAARHLFQRQKGDVAEHRAARPRGLIAHEAVEQQIHHRRMEELRGMAEAAVFAVEGLHRRVENGGDGRGVQARRGAGGRRRLHARQRLHHPRGGFLQLLRLLPVGVGDAFQHARKAGAAAALDGREVGPAKKGFPVRSQKRRQRPTALAAERGDGQLITGIHVRTLIAIHLDGDEIAVDHRGDARIFIALAVHHVAPMAPHRADVQQDGAVLFAGAGKGRLAPAVPFHGLMRGSTQIGAGTGGKTIGHIKIMGPVSAGLPPIAREWP